MTDKETLTAMFERAGIQYTDVAADSSWGSSRDNGAGGIVGIPIASRFEVEAGYSGFVSCFDFDANGRLLTVSAWE